MKSGHRSSRYALGSVDSSLRLLRFAAALRVTRRSPGREELSWPEGDFRPSRTGNDHLHHHNQAASWRRSAAPCTLELRAEFHHRSLLFPTLVLIRKAVSYWEIRTKEAFSSPGFVIVVWQSIGAK